MNTQADIGGLTLVRGGTVLAGTELAVRPHADLWVRGSRIEAITAGGERAPPTGCAVVEADGHIVMPGLIDTHRHVWQTPLRGLGADLTAPEYRHDLREKVAPHYQPEDVFAATLAGMAEALDCGITTMLDWAHIMNSPAHADASVAALRASGGRAVFGHGAPNDAQAASWWRNSERPHPADARRIRRDVLADDGALVTMALAARAPHLVQPQVMRHDWALGRALGLRIVVDGGIGGGLWGPRSYPLRQLRHAGLLGSDTTYVHCNNLEEDEYAAIAESGGSVSLSPCAEMHVGFGMPATGRVLAHGLRPSLSIDYVTQVAGDMFSTMRAILASERGLRGRQAFAEGRGVEPWTLRTRDVLEFATSCGAAALGLGHRTGALLPGLEADLVLIDTRSLRLSPCTDPIATVVLYASPGDVAAVMVGGRWVKANGKLLSVDADHVRGEVVRARDRLLQRAGLVRTT